MNSLWKLLRCPACGDELTVDRRDEARQEALLRSGCGLWFPVVDDIPRIFIGEMRTVYERDFASFLDRHGLAAAAGGGTASDETAQKLATRESFGFEWTRFHQMLPEWETAARFYFEPIGSLESLAGLTLLDAGCGKARQAWWALRAGARVVAVDFSRAIDVAARNCADVGGDRLFVQADLMALPFAPASFDLVCSFGVLHHLPDPERGFRGLAAFARPHGRVLVYLYHALEDAPLKRALLRTVTAARRITTRMPHGVLLPLTTALGYTLYAGVVLPYKALSRVDALKPLAERMPLKFYADYPVHAIVNDQFDRFSAPIENRYTRAEVQRWLDDAGLRTVAILGGSGWRAAGERVESR